MTLEEELAALKGVIAALQKTVDYVEGKCLKRIGNLEAELTQTNTTVTRLEARLVKLEVGT